jgi:hypothetical protein
MDNTTLVIAAIVAAVVGFFAYQWYLAAQKGKAAKRPRFFAKRWSPSLSPSPIQMQDIPKFPDNPMLNSVLRSHSSARILRLSSAR